MRTDTPE